MNKMTIGEYLGYLSSCLEQDPDLANQTLYSVNGILFGWEDVIDWAERKDITLAQAITAINQGYLEGVRSNGNIIVPKEAKINV